MTCMSSACCWNDVWNFFRLWEQGFDRTEFQYLPGFHKLLDHCATGPHVQLTMTSSSNPHTLRDPPHFQKYVITTTWHREKLYFPSQQTIPSTRAACGKHTSKWRQILRFEHITWFKTYGNKAVVIAQTIVSKLWREGGNLKLIRRKRAVELVTQH